MTSWLAHDLEPAWQLGSFSALPRLRSRRRSCSDFSPLSWAELVDLLVVSNVILGLVLALAGWPIAVYRPRNLIGWSLLAGGCCWASTGAGIALLAWAHSQVSRAGSGESSRRSRTWVGRGPSRSACRWRCCCCRTAACQADGGAGRSPFDLQWAGNGCSRRAFRLQHGGWRPGYFTWHAIHALSWPMAVLGVTVLSSYGLVLAALVVRFFRASDQVRRQLSWCCWPSSSWW